MNPVFAGLFGLGTQEVLILLVIGVLLFGKRLPEVGRYLGKGIVEFKKGVKGLEDDMGNTMAQTDSPAVEQPRVPQRVATTAPKFEDSSITTAPPKI